MERKKMNKLGTKSSLILYSKHWPESFAIKGLNAIVSSDIQVIICFSPEKLAEKLSVYTNASVILGILPHESIFLLSKLKYLLQKRHVMFFGKKFNYADRMIPFYFFTGDIKFYEWKNKTTRQTRTVFSDFLITEAPYYCTDRHIPLQPVTTNPEELIYCVNRYLYKMFSAHGVSKTSGKVLFMLSYGLSTEEIARLLEISAKTVSVHKYKGLSLLGMETGSYNIYHGIFVRAALQQHICRNL